jgi:hypothetical protein
MHLFFQSFQRECNRKWSGETAPNPKRNPDKKVVEFNC